MPEDHVATVASLYEAFGRGDIATIVDAVAEDVDWEAGAVDHGLPLLAPGRGKAHVAAFFEQLADVEFKRFEPRLLFGSGDHVMAVIGTEFLVPKTGRSVREDAEGHLWTFGSDGKVVAFRHYVDTLQHAQAWSG
jgi:ketosteroid isomerase-like protein